MTRSIILFLVFISIKISAQEKVDALQHSKAFNETILTFTQERDTIPIEIWNDLILLKMKIGNQTGDFVWDNGFSVSAVDSTYVDLKKLNQNKTITKTTDGVGTDVDISYSFVDDIQMGSGTINQVAVIPLNTKTLFQTNRKIIGVLGSNIIKKINWKFDFDKSIVVLSKQSFNEEGKTIPFEIKPNNSYYTAITINGHTAGMHIDFGSNSNEIELPIAAIPLFEGTKKVAFQGFSGMSVGGLIQKNEFYRIKDFEYNIVNTKFDFPITISLSYALDEFARIGNRPLRNYNVIFNNSENHLILTKRNTSVNPRPKKSYGFIIAKLNNKGLIAIKSANPNTNKYSDVKIGDEIIIINNKPINEFESFEELREYQINQLLLNKNLEIVTKDSTKIVLTPQFDIYE